MDVELDKVTSDNDEGAVTRKPPVEVIPSHGPADIPADPAPAVSTSASRRLLLPARFSTFGGEQLTTLRLQLETEKANVNRYRALFDEYKDTSCRYKEKASKLKLEVAETKGQLKRAHERASAAELRATNSHQMAIEAEVRAEEAEETAAYAEADLENAQCEAEERIEEVEERLAAAERAATEAEARCKDAESAVVVAEERRTEAEKALGAAQEDAEHSIAKLNERLSKSEAAAADAKLRLEAAESYIQGTKQLFDDIGIKHSELYKKYTEDDPAHDPFAKGVAVGQAGLSTADRLIYMRGLHNEVEEFVSAVYSKIRKTLDCAVQSKDEYLFPDEYLDDCSDIDDTEETDDNADMSNSDAVSDIVLNSEVGEEDGADGTDDDAGDDKECESDSEATEDGVEVAADAGTDGDTSEACVDGHAAGATEESSAQKEPCEEYSAQEETWLRRAEELVGLRGLHLGDLLLLDRVYWEGPTAADVDYLEAHLKAIKHEGKELWNEVKHECADIIRERRERKEKERLQRKRQGSQLV